MDFDKRLKYAMEKRNMTQAELSRKTEIDKPSISYYVKGEYEPKYDRIEKIAQALNVNAFWLTGSEPFFFQTDFVKDHYETSKLLVNLIQNFIKKKGITIEEFFKDSHLTYKIYQELLNNLKENRTSTLLINNFIIKDIAKDLNMEFNTLLEKINDNPTLSEYNHNIDSYTIKQNQDINTIPGAKKINTNSKTVSLPILGTVPAGFGKNPFFEIDEWTECPVDILPYSENPEERYYILRVSGDSMYSKLQNKDLIIVDIKQEVKNGDIGVFRINDETTVKTFYFYPDRIELVPYNTEAFTTTVYPLSSLEDIGFEIQGKVVGLYFRPI
jgi:SOS-response transcriptional repressor LexA